MYGLAIFYRFDTNGAISPLSVFTHNQQTRLSMVVLKILFMVFNHSMLRDYSFTIAQDTEEDMDELEPLAPGVFFGVEEEETEEDDIDSGDEDDGDNSEEEEEDEY